MPATDDEIREKYLERAIRELNEFTRDLQACCSCPRGNLMPVLGSGHPQADVFLLKYAPAPAEIEEGVAFYGRSGTALMKSLRPARHRSARRLRHAVRQVPGGRHFAGLARVPRAAGRGDRDRPAQDRGHGPAGQLFTYRPEHTPYSQPQRRLCVGLYTGVRQPDPMNVTLSVSPGHGEMIVIPTITFDGVANALLMENVPGGDMEELATLSYDDNPRHFLSVLLGKLEKHHPTTYDRIDTARFDLAQPQDLLQGGVVPTVRNTVVQFDDGKCAIALGDVHAIVDPMMGQGANVASYAAFVLGEEIVHSDVLDARFCEKVDLKRQDRVLAASRWTNVMLQPPTEALGMLIGAMSQNPGAGERVHREFQLSRTASGTASRRRSASRPGSSACRRRLSPVRMRALREDRWATLFHLASGD